MSGFRLSRGGRIDRGRRLRFTWDGREHFGYGGDTLAAALLANGERVLARSFKYHRPRGVMSAGVEESGAVVSLWEGARRIANAKATQVELVEGLAAFGQNAWPSVRFDLGAINSVFGRFFAAGFYYKTFFGILGRRTWEWMLFEKLIRRAAGMGTASSKHDPDHYEIVHDHCDVAVVGSGPAGLAAAEALAAAGLDTVLIEQDFAPGGSLLSAAPGEMTEGARTEDWIAARLAAPGLRLWTRTTAFGLYDHGVLGCLERVTDHLAEPHPALPRERLRVLRARRIVLAPGAIERPIAFGDNDRPGVMLGGAVRSYAHRFGVAAGRRIVWAAANDQTWADAADMARSGVQVTLLDPREMPPEPLLDLAKSAGIEVLKGYVPVEAQGASGVTGLMAGRHLGDGKARPEREIPCDAVAVSGGWSPAIHLLSHRGIRPVWSEPHLAFLPGETGTEPVHTAGSVAGLAGTEAAIASGRIAAEAAAKALGATAAKAPPAPEAAPGTLIPLWEVRVKAPKLKSFVDPQNDVTADDVRLAEREGYVSVEHMKRYTTLGMSTDQGKIGNVIGMALMAEATGKSIPETGITTFRPPYTPASIGALAGSERGTHWRPTRHTPMRAAHDAAGARWTDAGAWKRAWYYPATEDEDLTEGSMREATEVRTGVGMVDVSTLGKIQVQGPDAAEFLNRVYSNPFLKLPVGRARYGLMLRDDGIVFDDGTTWRLSETEFFMTTTTANAGPVMLHLARMLQTRWTDLRVHISSVSDHWCGVAVAGPKARAVLDPAFPDIDFADAAFPFMGVREGHLTVAGGTIPARVARLSFSGEQAWEVFVPSDWGIAMWEALLARVKAAGGVAYGLEALDILRVEKGHVTARELDGRTTAHDLGLGAMASKTKAYVGSVLKERAHLTRADRPRLVGLVPVAEGGMMRAGAILCAEGESVGDGLGWVSSIADSPTFGKRIGLGFVRGGLAQWEGREIVAESPVRQSRTRVRVVSPHFFDPDGGRMHG